MSGRGLEWDDMGIHFVIALATCLITGLVGNVLGIGWIVWIMVVANLVVWFMRERATQDFQWNLFNWGPRGKSEFAAGAVGAFAGTALFYLYLSL